VSRRIALATLLGTGAAIAAVGLMAVSAWLISRASEHPGASALGVSVALVQLFALSRALLRYGERLAGHDAALRALADLRVRVFGRLETLAPAGLEAFRRGDLLARLVDDVDALLDQMLRARAPFAVALLGGAVTVAAMWLVLPVAGAILLVALVLAGVAVPWLTARAARRSEARSAASRGELAATIVDLLEGADELVVNGAAGGQLAKAAASDAELARIAAATARTSAAGIGSTVLLAGVAAWACLLAGVGAVDAGRLDGVFLAAVALVPLAAFELVAGLPAAAQVLSRARGSAARVEEVLRMPPVVAEPRLPVAVPRAPHGLRVRGLRVRYGTAGPWALDGVDLDLAPGRSVAVVGASGAGKTTLAHALLRFLPYQGGSVTLGGVEIADLDGDAYRRVVGLVAQDAHVFDTTLEANLRIARPGASAAELEEAMRRAQLGDWTGRLATAVGEHGARLSGGERRRLAVARAVLAEFPVVVLDEPTEHLDPEAAGELLAALLATGAATLLITHRLAGLDAVDEIVVLDRGRVVERGSHAELLRRDGRYARLSQSSGGADRRPRNT
jgi:thiol reductant ABC exporter CydC subunit